MVRDTVIRKFVHEDEEKHDEFEKVMNIHSGNIASAFSWWVSRILKRKDWSVRRERISQSVPTDWFEISVEACHIIREIMRKAGVTKLVNADEMFLNYYSKEDHLIAPRGVKRTGSNRKENEKKGCTVMISAECFGSVLHAPFVIITAKCNDTLARKHGLL